MKKSRPSYSVNLRLTVEDENKKTILKKISGVKKISDIGVFRAGLDTLIAFAQKTHHG